MNLHQGQPILAAGTPLERAPAAMILLHGRGVSAGDILALAAQFDRPELAYLAPQAAGSSWYPRRFLDPADSNEPWLSSALQAVTETWEKATRSGIPPDRTILVGFSQGACLALEWGARHARRFGGLAGLSGGLIGAEDEPRQDRGSLAGTPVFLGCSDPDPHVPRRRVEHAAQVLSDLGGKVTLRLYPNLGHTVNRDEIDFIRQMIDAVLAENVHN